MFKTKHVYLVLESIVMAVCAFCRDILTWLSACVPGWLHWHLFDTNTFLLPAKCCCSIHAFKSPSKIFHIYSALRV